LKFTNQQIESLITDLPSFKAGKGLSSLSKWISFAFNDRVMWGEIKGSGANPYRTQIDIQNIAFKCSCPSFKFPCKHSIGLMLLNANEYESFQTSQTEPDWVKEWIDKRQAKAEKATEPEVEKTDEEIIKSEKSKAKRINERVASVEDAVAEFDLWLKDLIRTGTLTLPTKDWAYFEKMAKRMVDNKASGLATWVKALANLNYHQESWKSEALTIIAKASLLIQAFKNLQNLNPELQYSVKSLIGWNQSTKELLEDKTAFSLKENWLVLGQETENNEELIIQRNWLIGIKSGQSALILNFGTKFSPLVTSLLAGTIIEAELTFFPTIWKNRAVIKQQRGMVEEMIQLPIAFQNWLQVFNYRTELLSAFPWVMDIPILIDKIKLVFDGNNGFIVDENKNFQPLIENIDLNKIINIMAIMGNNTMAMAGVLRKNGFLPLGVFENNEYLIIP
jgi:uncharacterized Zn finger protein